MYPSTSVLDVHVGMFYRATRPPRCTGCIVAPRERSFIVVEDHGLRPRAVGRYCLYILAKRGLTSHEAARLLAAGLGVRPSRATLLGLKDEEATTVQAVCVPCPDNPPMLLRLAGGRAWARLAGRLEECPRPGTLRGNRFTIILKPASCSVEELRSVVERAAAARLPAYYSYQRFGVRRPNSHIVGLLLLRREHAEAYMELLGNPYPDESPATRRCRLALWAPEECKKMPWAYEARLAQAEPEKLAERLPAHIARLLAGAVQAYIFNLYLSERIRRGYRLEERLKGERLTSDGRPLAPVPGLGRRLGVSGEARSLLKTALEQAGISEEDLAKPPRRMRVKPYWRPTYTKPASPRITVRGDRLVVSFAMEKGMYATLLLREFIPYPDEACPEMTGRK